MKSIKLKLVIIYLTLVFIVMILSGTFMLVRTKIQQENVARNALETFAQRIYSQVIMMHTDPSKFSEGLKNIYSQGTINSADTGQKEYISLNRSIQGNILSSTGVTIATFSSDEGTQFTNRAITSALAGTPSFDNSEDTDIMFLFKRWLNYALPVKDEEGKVEYVIYVRMEAKDIDDNLIQLGTTLVFTLCLALLLTIILGSLFSNTLTTPIMTLTKKAKEMAKGNLIQEIPVNSEDEIGQLTESFNNMAKGLSCSMATMSSEKNKLEILLHNMTDGVLAYDANGILIHANFLCQELLKLDDVNTKEINKIPFSEMMKNLNYDITDVHSLSPDTILESTMSSGDKFLGVSLTTYGNQNGEVGGLVVVLQDITKHKKLDNIRKEFVANVSHEIRTPLTTIKSYVETLLDGAMDDEEIAVEFLKIVNAEADRMTFLVKDLLDLSRFDSNQFNLTLAKIDLIDILTQAIKQNEILAEKKSQQIVFENPNKNYIVMADSSRINQVFANIIGNAIKYSYENSKIEIYTEETEKYYRVFVRDNGIGIPKDDLWRIFERFYRVDKARSRAMGGTGLGLAISKEIMEAHEGKIMVTSEEGKGSTMILRFNKISSVN